MPPGLADLVAQCLAKEQRGRPQSATVEIETLETATTPAASSPVAVATSPHAPPSEDRASTVAVLPLANMSADPDAECSSYGMSEEVINAPVPVPEHRVIARTSSFAFKGKTTDIREIGERLVAGVTVTNPLPS